MPKKKPKLTTRRSQRRPDPNDPVGWKLWLKEAPVRDLFSELRRNERQDIVEELAARHAGLAVGLAKRFMGKGEPLEDLIQVANMALVLAIRRYDPQEFAQFVSFATPTILGEIKRYFRDKGWTIRVPRKLQELNRAAHQKIEELTQTLGRPPSIPELAEALECHEEDLIEAVELGQAYRPLSLDAEFDHEDREIPTMLRNLSGELDTNIEAAGLRAALEEAIDLLPPEERQILTWRFFDNLTQAEIAERLNVSQMQVSRVQKRTLWRLKQILRHP